MSIYEAFYNGSISCRTMNSFARTVQYLTKGEISGLNILDMDIYEVISMPNFMEVLVKNGFGGKHTLKEINALKG